MLDGDETGERLDVLLAAWAGTDALRGDVARTVSLLLSAALTLRRRLDRAPLSVRLDEVLGTNASGDVRKVLDAEAHELFVSTLAEAPVAVVASEESDTPVPLRRGGTLAVALDPLDGSGNTTFDGPCGSIFSIRAVMAASPQASFLTRGHEQLAAGFVLYGPATMLALSLGDGTDIFAFDPDKEVFIRTCRRVRVPAGTPVFAVNASNARHWTPAFTSYVTDMQEGAHGLRGRDFNMRWYGALVIEAFRILTHGGIYLCPADDRPQGRSGRLRLLYEAHPIALVVEQAGGEAIDGQERILDKAAETVHDRTPLIFGSSDKVQRVERYLKRSEADAERHPLFRKRGLFRD